MSRLVPYPLLLAGLVLMWLLLNRFSLGHLLLGTAIGLIAVQSMSALDPAKPRLRRWHLLVRLFVILLYDILRSNLAVARIILTRGQGAPRRPGFIEIPLTLRDRNALALLAIILTSTPGSAWMEYDADRGILLLHVLDLVDEAEWIALVQNRYERLLIEVFE